MQDGVKGLLRRREPTDQERTDRAELEAFRPGFRRAPSPKNRVSQVSLVLALAATLAGGSLALVGSYVGLALFVVGLPATVATGWWAFRHWDY